MYPVNQVIVGGSDPIFNSMADIDNQIKAMESYKLKLQQLKQQSQAAPSKFIWDDIDVEISALTNEQKQLLLQDNAYADNYLRIQELVNKELINLIKDKIESSKEGSELLKNQLSLVKTLKQKIIEDTNREMQTFKQFREYSKTHPEVTYQEFLKENM